MRLLPGSPLLCQLRQCHYRQLPGNRGPYRLTTFKHVVFSEVITRGMGLGKREISMEGILRIFCCIILRDLDKADQRQSKLAPVEWGILSQQLWARRAEGRDSLPSCVLLRQAREEAGLTQEELAHRINTKKTAISRIENHAEDIKLSTLEKFVSALGKQLTITVA